LSNNNPLSHSDLQALSNAIDNPVNNAKEAEKILSNLSDDVIRPKISLAVLCQTKLSPPFSTWLRLLETLLYRR
jgi:hypothetical protein